MVRASQSAQTPKPLELGAKLLCRWRGDEVKPCEVLERQQNEDSGEWEYCARSPRRDRLPRPSPCAPPAPSRRALRGDEPAHGRVGAAGPLRPGLGDRGGQADAHVEAQVRPRGARGGGRAGPGDAQGARGGDQGEERDEDTVWRVGDGDVVLLALPQGVPEGAQAVLLRVRPQLLRAQGAAQPLHEGAPRLLAADGSSSRGRGWGGWVRGVGVVPRTAPPPSART